MQGVEVSEGHGEPCALALVLNSVSGKRDGPDRVDCLAADEEREACGPGRKRRKDILPCRRKRHRCTVLGNEPRSRVSIERGLPSLFWLFRIGRSQPCAGAAPMML